jgi:hypothetical protein
MIMQQANMAMLFMGHVPHPETGEMTVDLNAARFFIDQLEMLEAKTKGNLDRNEEALLKQHLMNLRMAFVKAADEQPAAPKNPAPGTATPSADSPAETPPDAAAATDSDPESRKKFSKKY